MLLSTWGSNPHRWSLQAKGKRHSSLYILFFFFLSPQQKGHYSLQVELGRWNVQFSGSSCPFSSPLFHPKAAKPSRAGWECPILGATSSWCHQPTVAPQLPPAPHWPTLKLIQQVDMAILSALCSQDNAQARILSPNPNNPWLLKVFSTFLLCGISLIFAVRPLYYHSLYVWSLCSKVLSSSGCSFVFSQEKKLLTTALISHPLLETQPFSFPLHKPHFAFLMPVRSHPHSVFYQRLFKGLKLPLSVHWFWL